MVNKYLTEKITKSYKKSNMNKAYELNLEAKKIADKLLISDRVDRLQNNEAYITIKDHKEIFQTNPTFRLINPSKTNTGKISMKILDKINEKITSLIGVNQWKNSNAVIEWFKKIENKSKRSFIVFDIENFYPSISSTLFNNAIQFAKEICEIPDNDLSIIMHSRKTLFNNGEPWIKKGDEEDFDVSMGCLDGAEVCELTGTYLLHQLIDIIPKEDLGLYRDDGLGTVNNLSGPEKERIKKQIVRIFKINGLNITIKTNLKTADFLDVHFDLTQDIYKPYKKPNDDPLYINKNSNHPPTIIKQIPKAIVKTISDISSNKEICDRNNNYYKETLERSGYNNITLSYNPSQQQRQDDLEQREQSKRKIIWFDPPFSLNVKTNAGKKFLKLLTHHFPKSNPLHKLFNRNTFKISSCCIKNMGSIISSHNKQILQPS